MFSIYLIPLHKSATDSTLHTISISLNNPYLRKSGPPIVRRRITQLIALPFHDRNKKVNRTQGSRVSITNWSKSNTNHLTTHLINHQRNLNSEKQNLRTVFRAESKMRGLIYLVVSFVIQIGFIFFICVGIVSQSGSVKIESS